MAQSIENMLDSINKMKLFVLVLLCMQNTMYAVLRRYSLGVLKENYSKHEVLLAAEAIKLLFSAVMVTVPEKTFQSRLSYLSYLVRTSGKMIMLAVIYGAMNILSFIALRTIDAGTFTIFAQCKILTTALFSTILLKRSYSWSRWRALLTLMLGVLLFSEPIWSETSDNSPKKGVSVILGIIACMTEVTLSGFSSIYFEKVIKNDPDSSKLGIWERNFQLALGSFPIYIIFILWDGGGDVGFGGGWSPVACMLATLGAAGGLLVALAIKYGDSIVKTLATTSAIVLSASIDNLWLGGIVTPIMAIGALLVIVSICNYAFDPTPIEESVDSSARKLREHQSDADASERIDLIEQGSPSKQPEKHDQSK